jgi:hypothetical protein
MTSTEQVLAAAAERRRTPLVRAAQCLAFMKSMRGDMSDTGDLSDTVFVDLSDPLKARHAIFISYSRRDPGALNAGYAFISAWRHGLGPEGRPFCAATYLDGEVPPRCAPGRGGAAPVTAKSVATIAVRPGPGGGGGAARARRGGAAGAHRRARARRAAAQAHPQGLRRPAPGGSSSGRQPGE